MQPQYFRGWLCSRLQGIKPILLGPLEGNKRICRHWETLGDRRRCRILNHAKTRSWKNGAKRHDAYCRDAYCRDADLRLRESVDDQKDAIQHDAEKPTPTKKKTFLS